MRIAGARAQRIGANGADARARRAAGHASSLPAGARGSQNARIGAARGEPRDLSVFAIESDAIEAREPARTVAFCKPRRTARFAGGIRLVARQQLGAGVATLADYLVMAMCVSAIGLAPARATALGAFVGGVVGFLVARGWVFRATRSAPLGQAVRYFAVSLGSLAANVGGEALLVRSGLHYLAARPIVSVAVALGWNLPLQTGFVFRRRDDGRRRAR